MDRRAEKLEKEKEMIKAFELNGILTLSYGDRMVDIDLDGLDLFEVVDYIERKTGKQVDLTCYFVRH